MSDCFRCDGTGEICDICGESEAACECDRDGMRVSFSECPDCGGGDGDEDEDGNQITDDDKEA